MHESGFMTPRLYPRIIAWERASIASVSEKAVNINLMLGNESRKFVFFFLSFKAADTILCNHKNCRLQNIFSLSLSLFMLRDEPETNSSEEKKKGFCDMEMWMWVDVNQKIFNWFCCCVLNFKLCGEEFGIKEELEFLSGFKKLNTVRRRKKIKNFTVSLIRHDFHKSSYTQI